ncbi:MAG: hypothetical protein AAGB15_03060 [Pseudomonadota bacterium]
MTRSLPLILAAMALGSCGAVNDAAFPVKDNRIVLDDQAFKVQSRYDPSIPGYLNGITLEGGRLTGADRARVIALVENQVGPLICDGGAKMKFTEGAIWGGVGPDYAFFQDKSARWIIMAPCT